MSKHTPGPWAVVEYGNWDAPTFAVHSSKGMRVCFMATPGSHGDPEMIEADAHLIAAAPELLAIGKKLLDKFDSATKSVTQWDADELRDAIAKAEGQTP